MKQHFDVFNVDATEFPAVENNIDEAYFYALSSGTFKTADFVETFEKGDFLVFIRNKDDENKSSWLKITQDKLKIIQTNKPEFEKKYFNEIETIIFNTIKSIFVNSTFGDVIYTIDNDTHTIQTKINIDEQTIIKNQYGQLEAKK